MTIDPKTLPFFLKLFLFYPVGQDCSPWPYNHCGKDKNTAEIKSSYSAQTGYF